MRAIASLVNHLVARFYIKDPNIKNVLDIQLPTLATQWEMARNEICYLFKTKRISNLNTVDFELTTQCNLKCGVCPVNTGLLKKERRGSMELELFKKIIDRNRYLRRIRFTLWGNRCYTSKFSNSLTTHESTRKPICCFTRTEPCLHRN